MTVIPNTPSADSFNPEDLSVLCSIDGVSLMSYSDGSLSSCGTGRIVVYLSTQHHAIVLRFYDHAVPISLVLVSQSQAWVTDDQVLVIPRLEGGLWRIDCSASDPAAFALLQDVLTYFIRLENRHNMRNVLARVDPSSCHVTEVVADDVKLDVEEELDSSDDFVTAPDEESQKLPVILDESDPARAHRVRLMYRSGNTMVAGSDWVAQTLVYAGQILAKSIQQGSKVLERNLEPSENPMRLTDNERKILETIHSTTGTVSKVATGILDKVLSTAATGIQSLCHPSEHADPVRSASYHLGASVIQAAANVVGGVMTAGAAVLVSSRDGVVDIVHKKYGNDAGFAVEKTLGTTSYVMDTLVYFDGRGISRRVLVRGAHEFSTIYKAANAASAEREVLFMSPQLSDEAGQTTSRVDTEPLTTAKPGHTN